VQLFATGCCASTGCFDFMVNTDCSQYGFHQFWYILVLLGFQYLDYVRLSV